MEDDIGEAVFSLSSWSRLSTAAIAEKADVLNEIAGPDFKFIGVSKYSSGVSIASFRHSESDLEFNLIPGGDAVLGLSDHEYKRSMSIHGADPEVLQKLRPTSTIAMEPFLVSRVPLLERTVDAAIEIDWSLFRPDFQPLSGGETGDVPIYLSRSEVNAVVAKYGLALPTEAQWEYAVRGGASTPFYFGEQLPEGDELACVMSAELRQMDDSLTAANPFGIYGMMTGGWCLDSWSGQRWVGLDKGPPHVVRGGAAIYWPWQGAGEWMLALSAMRRSAEELEDQTCSAHVVRPLGG